MTRHPLRQALAAVVAGTATLASLAGTAAAYPTMVMSLAPGYGGPQEEAGGAGHEQSHSVVLFKEGKQYVVTVYMSSNVKEEDGPWQCKCTSVLMDPYAGPMVMKDQIQLTDFDGTRPCNHPRVAADGADHAVFVYGSDKNNNANVETYATVLNESCEMVTDTIMISKDNGNNNGAPDIAYNGNGYFTAGYLSTNNNDTSYARGLVLKNEGGVVSLEKTYHTAVVTPSNIGRPAIMDAGPDRSLFCASKGDNRPPEDGVQCAWLNAISGEVIWKQYVAESVPDQKIYMNQPSVAKLDYGRFAVQVLESSGQGKNSNIKGSNVRRLYVIEPNESGFVQKAYVKGIGTNATHSQICSGKYGDAGETYIALMGAPVTGVGQPTLELVSYNTNEGLVLKNNHKLVVGWFGDSGKIANIYGQNPNTQGRDFMRCTTDVPNPGYKMSGGYLPEVETFILAPHHGQADGEPKNGLYLSFVPGKMSKYTPPEPPKEQPKAGLPPTQGINEDPGTGTDPDTTDPTTEDPGTDDPYQFPQRSACSVSHGEQGTSTSAGLVLIALGALFAARRSKRS